MFACSNKCDRSQQKRNHLQLNFNEKLHFEHLILTVRRRNLHWFHAVKRFFKNFLMSWREFRSKTDP